MRHTLVNVNEFRREALHFLKYGYYTDAFEGTKEWLDYWKEQKERCLKGYSVGGVRITGYHYFYLNFSQILAVPIGATNISDKVQTFPQFWDGDYEFFWAVEIARHGITPDEYQALELTTPIRHLSGGKHIVVLKARGKGYSYKTGAMLARNYLLKQRSKNYAIADEKEYLITDGLLSKTWDAIAFNDQHCAWRQPRLIDRIMHKRSGYMERESSGYIERGNRSEIIGVTLKANPSKARGKRGELILYEEAGKSPALLQAWEINRPSIEQGAIVTGIQIAFGTGGTEDADYAGLEELFYHPQGYNCIPFENIWDEGAEQTSCGFFVPANQNFEGFIDEAGNSDEEGAEKFIMAERENKKLAKDANALAQYTAENPLNPREATLQVKLNLFPVADLQIHLNSLEGKGKYKAYPSGFLYEDEDGKVKFSPSPNHEPIYKYPLRKGDKEDGAVVIYEAPFQLGGNTPPDGMYIIIHDPYAKDKSESSVSIGSAYVMKMINPYSQTFPQLPVASYNGRPDTLDDYNDNLFKLARYYNAKICFENNRGSVVQYARQHKLLRYLYEEPESVKVKSKEVVKTEKKRIVYGMTMTEAHKDNAEIYLRDWMKETISVDEEGHSKMRFHYLYDPALVQELIKFSRKGNFDRVSAFLIGMFFMRDIGSKGIVKPKRETKLRAFMRRPLYV